MTRRVSRSAEELSDDEIAVAVLELVTGLVEGHLLAKSMPLELPELDRVRVWCPPECRYDFEGVA